VSPHEQFRITNAAKLSVGDVRAPACPVRSRPTWSQIIVAFATALLFVALFVGALTRDPVSLIGAVLSLAGLALFLFAFAGVVKARFTRRG
jgi:hypothetical protein